MFIHSHAYVPSCFYHLILKLFGTFLIVFLSFFLSLPPSYISCTMAPKRKSILSRNSLCSKASSFSSSSDPLPLMSDSMMRRPNRTSLRTFHNTAFIQNAKSFCQTSLRLTCPLSSIIEVWSHYVAPHLCALP